MDKFEFKKYLYYGIIGVLSLISLVFLPMIGSKIDGGFQFPTTVDGWLVYIITKLIIAVINVILFYCFMEQAKINVKEDKNYIKANEILNKSKNKEFTPRSPKNWNAKQYGSKGVSLFVCSILSTFVLTEAVLTYNYMSLLTYIFTIVMGVIFGILQMKSAEAYWTNEYYQYAILKEEEIKNETEDDLCLNLTENNIET